MQVAVPISAWQPASAPLTEAFVLTTFPTIPAAASARRMVSSERACLFCKYKSTAGSTPLAPQVGAVTTTPPLAFSSAVA